jgi:undecaprenyl-diphosphatase
LDTTIFYFLNSFAGRYSILDKIGIFFAEYLLYLFPLILLWIWFSQKNLRKNIYLALVSVVVGRLIVVEILKRLIDRPRPYEVLANIHQILADNEKGMAFPSGHAVVYFALAFSFYGTKWFWPLVILATLGSISRIFVGVHYPLDVLASVIIAAVVVLFLRPFSLKSKKNSF